MKGGTLHTLRHQKVNVGNFSLQIAYGNFFNVAEMNQVPRENTVTHKTDKR